MYKWFRDCKTAEQGKQLYRQLVKRFHPDNGSTGEELKEISAEFKTWWNFYKDIHDEKANNFYQEHDTTENINDTADKLSNSSDNATNESIDNKTENNNATPETTVNETNQTTVNKTNETNQTTANKTNGTKTVIINNTTINQNNTKIVKVANDTPENATIVTKLIKAVGNPIYILIAVIAIIAVVGIYARKKG